MTMASALGQYANAGAGLTKNAGALGQYSSGLSGLGNAAGIVSGIDQGGTKGDISAAGNAGKLAGNYLNNPTLNTGAGDVLGGLGVYQGIQQGGVGGYGGAAVNAAKLATSNGMLGGAGGALGQAAGYAAIPLSLYNEVNNWQSGNTLGDALGGAETGAAIGSIVPGVGTLIGGVAGGALGALSSAFGNGKVDPENANWAGYTGAYNQVANAGKQAGATQDQINSAESNLGSQVQNPYGALAGYFDLRDNQAGQSPMYAQYGRMGEQQFTNDMVSQINDATKAGTIGPNDSAADIYSKVVAPWESGFKGDASADPNSAAMQGLLTQMISQYEGGTASQDWTSRTGQQVFGNLGKPPNSSPPVTPGGPETAVDPTTLQAMADTHDQQRNVMGLAPAATQVANAPAPTPQVSNSANPVVNAVNSQTGNTNMARPVMARGGSLSRVAKRKRFDDGGDVDFSGGDDFSSQPSFDPGAAIDFNSLYAGGSGNDNQLFSNGLNDIQGQLNQDQFTNSQLGTYIDSLNANQSSKPGALSTLAKNATGGSGLTGLLKAYAPLIPLVAGAVNSKNAKAPTTAPGMTTSSISALPQAGFNRTQNTAATNRADGAPMTQQDWYTYGQRPGAQFFNNNSVPINQTVQGQAKGGKTPGGALGQMQEQQEAPEFDSAQESYVPDQGPGDGQSDDVPARLSKGEFVFDANTVSQLGNGSNSTGASKLEKLRQNLRKHAAKSNSKGKQFMHAKEPHQYMPKAGAK